MAYSLPDLMLVGAAQSLVLECSILDLKLAEINCYGPSDRDLIAPGDYNFESTW